MSVDGIMSDIGRPEMTGRLTRGVRRALAERGYATLVETRLKNGRRADVMAINETGEILIIEIKSSVADFRADQKWRDYLDFCDALYFAVDDAFPTDLIPEGCGLMIADAFGAAILRPAPVVTLHPSRRRSLILAFALAAGSRLHRLEDPMAGTGAGTG